jgi:hypothetical protein
MVAILLFEPLKNGCLSTFAWMCFTENAEQYVSAAEPLEQELRP